jgi:hypothetical protein
LSDPTDELMDALYEAAEEYGVKLTTGEQVAVAQKVAGLQPSAVTGRAIEAAFVDRGLRRPPAGYGSAVLARLASYGSPRTLLNVVLDYRQFAIGHLSRQFGGETRGHEEALRNSLHTYLPQHGFKEAQSGRGNTDIVIPDPAGGNRPAAIIETKVWKGRADYENGLTELETYIHNDKPGQAIYVVFGERQPLPKVIADATQAIAERRALSGIVVPVVVIPFEQVAPSKVRQTRREASGQA